MTTTQQSRQVWEAVLGELQLQVTRPSYETWFKDTVGVAYEGDEFVVGTPNAFVAEMLEQRMYSLISQAMERVTKSEVEVRFKVMTKETVDGDASVASVEAPLLDSSAPVEQTPPAPALHPVSLNPKYTFDTFIVGKSNELAHAAAVAVSENPGLVYNPLVMYSDVGLGKTHLMQAIGHRIRSQGKTLIYATTEEFTNEYIKAIQGGKTEEFRNHYRSADLLLLDDIQFLIGKEQTQEGFFHTFNALHMTNRQIVITSDRPVTALTLLQDRIMSRLAGGLVVDIQSPDLETRLAILRAKAEISGQRLDGEVLEFLAARVHKNIRELEGSLNRVIAYAQLMGGPITIELAKRATADLAESNDRRPVSDEAILDAVCGYFRIDKDTLMAPGKKKDVVQARQIAMYIMREETSLAAGVIGKILGGRDHSTVLHGHDRIENQLNVDSKLRQHIINIHEIFENS